MQKVAVEVRSWSAACAARGPSESQTTPARMREKAAPMTEATAAAERSALVRSRLLRMTGRSGGAAKVAKKAMMKEIQESWKACWWGAPHDQKLKTLLLRRGESGEGESGELAGQTGEGGGWRGPARRRGAHLCSESTGTLKRSSASSSGAGSPSTAPGRWTLGGWLIAAGRARLSEAGGEVAACAALPVHGTRNCGAQEARRDGRGRGPGPEAPERGDS